MKAFGQRKSDTAGMPSDRLANATRLRDSNVHASRATSALALAAGPAFLLIAGVVIYGSLAPIYAGVWGFDYDPAYIYLFNAAGMLRGYVPAHIDHPGTPLQSLAAGVIGGIWLVKDTIGRTNATFDISILQDAEYYVAAISVVLLLANCVALAFLGLRVRRASGSTALALAAQFSFLVGLAGTSADDHGAVDILLIHAVYLAPDALLIFASIMMVALLAPSILLVPVIENHVRVGIIAGAVAALGATAKIYFLPTALLLFLLPTRRSRRAAVLSMLVIAVILLAPVYGELLRWSQWLWALVRHTGSYGEGDPGFIKLAAIPERSVALIKATPIVFVAIAACVLRLALVLHRRGSTVALGEAAVVNQRAARCAIVLLTVLLIYALMVLKHYGVRYMLPAAAIAGFALLCAGSAVGARKSHPWRWRAAAAGFAAVALASTGHLLARLQTARIERDDAVRRITAVVDAHPGALTIGMYKVRDRRYAEQFGLEFVRPEYAARLTRGRGEEYGYNKWARMLYAPGRGHVPLAALNDVLTRGREVLMILPPYPYPPNIPAGLHGEILSAKPGQERVVHITGLSK